MRPFYIARELHVLIRIDVSKVLRNLKLWERKINIMSFIIVTANTIT